MITIREAGEKDMDKMVDLVVRLKRLNEEFDPLFKVSNDAAEQAKKYLEECSSNKDRKLLMIAETDSGDVVGIVVAEIRRRLFYEPSIEGVITDFYVMPEWRRKGVGKQMMDKAIALLKSKGAQLISAEFPAQNQIAVNFYKKYGFRPLTNIYVKEFQ
ncbi:N-acyltransferase [Thermocladium modestius]|uniref:N-acyltransferase n=1 Tax=Thermocladium modestius TaxID=62609 RepID=A0A830GUX4_9CREN|nr:GNAT family N-acetyltransferase [Thermocladium modestius]GGP20501.1 N-acyltransferase [Thermocladium modestius]